MLFRERIVKICEEDSLLFGEVKIDESYFKASRVRGKRGRGARGKTIVFGLLKREGKVLPDVTKDTLRGVYGGRLAQIVSSIQMVGAVINSLVNVGYDKHFRVHHGKNEFVRGNSHTNGIETFWFHTKIRLVKFHGMDKRTFNLHLKSVSLGSIIEVKIYINFC